MARNSQGFWEFLSLSKEKSIVRRFCSNGGVALMVGTAPTSSDYPRKQVEHLQTPKEGSKANQLSVT